MNDAHARLPRAIDLGGETIELRAMTGSDEAAVIAFAQAVSMHDLLFLARDITHPKVVKAWIRDIEAETITTLLAWRGDRIIGCAAIVRDRLAWSGHVAELRVVLLESMRGKGLGHQLTEEAFATALAAGAEKITARMTLDQKGAIAVFEGLGFTIEALLRDQVKDRDGRRHDILILSHDVARTSAQHEAYGLGEAF
jgi:RimJ/RimL family protein N-acetyltransferase